MDWSSITTINPESLTFLAIRVLVNHLPYLEDQVSKTWTENGQRYLTSNNQSAHSILRVTEKHGKEKHMMNFHPMYEENLRFDKDHADSIMNIFTSRFIHSHTLRFPPSGYIPSPTHLKNHLFHHGRYLTELSLVHCYSYYSELRGGDDVLEIIARGCSSNLKRLALPDTSRTLCITERGVKALATESEFAHTLLELRINGSYFSNIAVLTNTLRCFPSLVKLSLSNVKIVCRHCTGQILPFPLDNSLSRLEMLYMDKFNECCNSHICNSCREYHLFDYRHGHRTQKLTLEWIQFFECYPRLKSLQVFFAHYSLLTGGRRRIYCIDNDSRFIQALIEGLQTRDASPLDYVGLDTYDNDGTDGPSVVTRMNALKVTGNSKMEDLHFALERALESGVSEDAIFDWVSCRLSESWERSPKDLKTCRILLLIIDRLIPSYKHLSEVYYFCFETLLFMLKDPKLCKDQLGLTPSVVERLLLILTTDERPVFTNCDVHICQIFHLYRDVFCIDIFERALHSIIQEDYEVLNDQRVYFLELSKSCNYRQLVVIKKILGYNYDCMRELLKGKSIFYHCDIDIFIENLKERETFFVQQRDGAEESMS